MSVYIEDIRKAHDRIRPHLHFTPVLQSSYVNSLVNNRFQIHFKCEHLQKTGSFKVRGALNSVISAKEKYAKENKPLLGVVTHSSGNHGQAVAWAAKLMDVPCVVVVPQGTPKVKSDAIVGYGAELLVCENTAPARVRTCQQVVDDRNFYCIPPYDHVDTIAGQGTIGLEILEQIPSLDAIVVAVSGGGLASGIAIAAKTLKPSIRVYLVEPEGKELQPSLQAGDRLWSDPPKIVNSLADALRIQQVGHLTFPYLVDLCEKEVLTMTDKDMIEGMRLMASRMKQVIEAAAGTVVQAPLKYVDVFPSDISNVAVIVCGGNVDMDHLPWYQ